MGVLRTGILASVCVYGTVHLMNFSKEITDTKIKYIFILSDYDNEH